jgi:two-component system, NtrC family, sensor kinase
MRLAGKLTVALVLGIFVVMAGYAYLQIRQEVVLYEADCERVRHLGHMMGITFEEIWQREGEARLRELVARADPESGVRVVSLQAPAADTLRPQLSDAQFAALFSGDTIHVVRDDASADQWHISYVPIAVGGARPAALEVRESAAHQRRYIRMSRMAIGLATIGVALMCGLIATGLELWFVGRPIQRLRDKARRAGKGDFSAPLVLRQHDEIGDLAHDINAMCDELAATSQQLAVATQARIAALEQMRHSERLATVGQLAAGVAHELGTPLSVVSARAQLISSTEMPRGGVVTNADIIVDQADRMTEIIQQLLDFSRRRSIKRGLASLQHLVARSLALLSSVAERHRVALRCEPTDTPLLADVDQTQMQQALTNVMLNAIQSMPDGGRLTVRLGTQHLRPPNAPGAVAGDFLCIAIEDEGQGIAPEQMAHIFEPFFTTKAVGEGTGLGLAVAHGIVAEHGGWIAVESTVGKGSRFMIFLPQPTDAHRQSVTVAS